MSSNPEPIYTRGLVLCDHCREAHGAEVERVVSQLLTKLREQEKPRIEARLRREKAARLTAIKAQIAELLKEQESLGGQQP